MKGYIIPFGSRRIVSINKKIDLQKQQLQTVSDVVETDVRTDIGNRWKVFFSILLRGSLPMDYSATLAEITNPDYLFIRRAGVDRQFVKFLKKIKKRYPTCIIVDEIPTYPYMKESLQSLANWLLLPAELNNRRKLKRYIDRFFVYADDEQIFGIKTLRSMNGIDVRSITPVNTPLQETINLLAVAHMQPRHGYERIIKGLAEYYRSTGDRRVELFLVGDGSEVDRYKQLVRRENVQQYVHFYGKLVGEELKNVYQKASIAIEAFGYYKIGQNVATTLKTREYLAYGLPIISGNQIDVFNKYKFPYFLEFPNDSSVIDVSRIVDFHDQVYSGKNRCEISGFIHRYALEHADISQTMKPLLAYLQHACKKSTVEI